MNSREMQARIDAHPFWYHTIDVAPGVTTPGWFDLRHALDLIRRGALERLERAGVRLDGTAGEALDLSRHRVLKARRRAGLEGPRVTTVVRAGISVAGARVRPAEVVIEEPEAK